MTINIWRDRVSAVYDREAAIVDDVAAFTGNLEEWEWHCE